MLDNLFHNLIEFMRLNPAWAGFITFWIALLESLPVFGYLLPGSVILTGIGLLIGAKFIPMWDITLWAIAGAIVGDGMSFLLGKHYHENIRQFWIFKRYIKWLDNGEEFFAKHGGKSVFLGRFFGPLRPMIPLIAGMMDMSRPHFLLANITSAILWAPAHLLPGVILGALSLTLSPRRLGHFVAAFLLLLVASYIGGMLLRWIMIRMVFLINRVTRPIWLQLRAHPFWPRMQWIFSSPGYPEADHYQLSLVFGMVFLSLLFGLFALSDIHHGWVTFYDDAVHAFFARWQNPGLMGLATIITFFGDRLVLLGLATVLLLYLLFKRAFYPALCLIMTIFVTVGTVYVLKHLLDLGRPVGAILVATQGSFPSGHTTLSAVLYGFIVVLIRGELKPNPRWFLYHTVLIGWSAVVVSRLVLGSHWLSDIVGSILLAGALLLFSIFIYRRQPRMTIPALPFIITALITLLGLVSLFAWNYFILMPSGHNLFAYLSLV